VERGDDRGIGGAEPGVDASADADVGADAGRQGDAARTLARAIRSSGAQRSFIVDMRELLVDLARSLDAVPEGAPSLAPDPGGYRPCAGSDPDWPHNETGFTLTLERVLARVVEGFGARAPDRLRNALVPLLSRRAAGNQARYQAFDQAEQLRVLAWMMTLQNRYDAALVPAGESVELLRRLVVPGEPSQRWMLALGLGILVDYSRAAGRTDEALGYAQELVAERRAMLPEDFVAYAPTGATASHGALDAPAPGSALARALGDLADLLRLADRLPEAVEAGRETFALYAELAQHHPEHRRDLGQIAAEFADLQLQLDRPDEALDALRTEAEVFGELAAEDEQYTGRAAEAFTNLSDLLLFTGGDGPARSLAAAERAVGLLEGRGAVEPDSPFGEAYALLSLSTALLTLGRTVEAADPAEQAVAICRAAADGGDEGRAALARGLSLAGVCALRLGHPEDGVAAAREAVGKQSAHPQANSPRPRGQTVRAARTQPVGGPPESAPAPRRQTVRAPADKHPRSPRTARQGARPNPPPPPTDNPPTPPADKPFHGHGSPPHRIGPKPHTLTPEDRCMPGITREEVAHLARLARLELKGEELDHFAGQLDDIIGAVARVSEVADQDVPPTSHPLPLTNVMRADEVRPSLTPEQALSGAPAQEQQRFKVPQILGED
jgi:aspartyl-tRNA(Asn)/glutamyl-tRNA(Gln) amidotransferase subunit C